MTADQAAGESVGALLAVDAGNSKTDLAVVDQRGKTLARLRIGGFRPHVDGDEATLAMIRSGVAGVLERAGDPPVALVAAYLANADLPVQEERFAAAIRAWGVAASVRVANDTFALLRSGSSGAVGVAVVCGAGINCVGVGADGTQVRFPALGLLTGDWGGGHGLAAETMFLAARGEDGRGEPTALSRAVAEHFGAASAVAVGISLHLGELAAARLFEVTPLLFAVAQQGDAVALRLVARQADEVVTMAGLALRRLGLTDRPCEVILGGGVLTARHPVLMDRIEAGLRAVAPQVAVRIPVVPPLVGAVLLGMDELADTGTWPGDREAREQLISAGQW